MNASVQIEIPIAAGTPFGGGIYAGRFYVGANPYALVIAPKDGGEQKAIAWGAKKKIAESASSWCDGLANTQAMAGAGSKLAQWALALRLDGFDDWYVPSRLESLMAFSEVCKTAEFEPDWYWTSTPSAGDASFAWSQHFTSGYQYYGHKDDELRARAVRRVPL